MCKGTFPLGSSVRTSRISNAEATNTNWTKPLPDLNSGKSSLVNDCNQLPNQLPIMSTLTIRSFNMFKDRLKLITLNE